MKHKSLPPRKLPEPPKKLPEPAPASVPILRPIHIEACGNCCFSMELPDDALGVICRRYPPIPFKFTSSGEITTVFPVPRRDHWCGEWRERTANATEN